MNSKEINVVGENILKKRKGADLSQKALAEKLSVTWEMVSSWENLYKTAKQELCI
ncbi:helix-turn-helix domain-containing protein [Geosporobacter ferrireducens]|uniref:helix-turn-helix domain-containing protein n=1 Tax=Geosporobacter ferrireducens TaxID=1424294 RepID=UPI001F1E74A1|nr:helix-turn-helix transcriptional regulator [Geosporobacter ferrireducens]